MLIAKVLDKLFNRRNTFEVESLEGDITYNDISLKEVTDWVSQMKAFVSLNQLGYIEVDAVMLTGGLGGIVNSDEEPFFPDLTDQAGKFVVVNQDETGVEYGNPSDNNQDEYIYIEFTESDFDEEDYVYRKNFQLENGKYYRISTIHEPLHQYAPFILVSPNISSVVGLDEEVDSLEGKVAGYTEPSVGFVENVTFNCLFVFGALIKCKVEI